MRQVETTTEPGWRPDPSGRFDWRYWDGGWTNRVANAGAPPAPAAGPGPGPAAAAPTAAPPGTPAPPAPTIPTVTAPLPVPAGPTTPAADTMAPPVEPFGPDVRSTLAPATTPARRRRTPWVWAVGFVRSFADQPESYHSDHTAPELPPDPRGEHIVARPGNYGHAGLVALAACGIGGGAYLPWLAGTLDGIPFSRTGFDLGHGWGYTVGAVALALSALLSVQMRVLRWLTMGLALVLAGLVTRDLINTYDAMQKMNLVPRVEANVAMGLWIMVISAAIAMIASVRAGEDEKIV
jgi:hypothetical protein